MDDKSYKLWIRAECPFCIKAQALMIEHELAHEVVILDQADPLWEEIKETYKWETVPIIIEENNSGTPQLIGGYTDMVEHLEKNK